MPCLPPAGPEGEAAVAAAAVSIHDSVLACLGVRGLRSGFEPIVSGGPLPLTAALGWSEPVCRLLGASKRGRTFATKGFSVMAQATVIAVWVSMRVQYVSVVFV